MKNIDIDINIDMVIFENIDIVEERNSRAGSGGLSPERGGILGSVIWTLVLSTPLRNIYCYNINHTAHGLVIILVALSDGNVASNDMMLMISTTLLLAWS